VVRLPQLERQPLLLVHALPAGRRRSVRPELRQRERLLRRFSIVGGHEYAETITDPYPNSGWLDGRGAENGDKCAWISSGTGAAQDISLSTGKFAVQSLWSNATSSCVISY